MNRCETILVFLSHAIMLILSVLANCGKINEEKVHSYPVNSTIAIGEIWFNKLSCNIVLFRHKCASVIRKCLTQPYGSNEPINVCFIFVTIMRMPGGIFSVFYCNSQGCG